MKHYLITGGAGFIGANFVKYLLRTYSGIQISSTVHKLKKEKTEYK